MAVFYVKTASRKFRIRVEADYYRVDAGVLWFRRSAANNGYNSGYPLAVRTFANGEWLDVEMEHG